MAQGVQSLADYVHMIEQMQPELKLSENWKCLLLSFLTLLQTKKDFEIMVEDVKHLLGCYGIKRAEGNLARILLPLKEGIDYKIASIAGACVVGNQRNIFT